MTVTLRFISREITGEARNGAYTLPAGSDIAALMAQAAQENGGFIANYMDFLIFLVNQRPAVPQTVLAEGDQVTALRRALGG